MGSRRGLDLLAIGALALFWGFNWPAVRTALDALGPWTLRSLGMGVGALVLLGLAAARQGRVLPDRGDWGPILIAGLFSITLFNLLLAFAQLMAPTSRAVIVTFTQPIWVVIFARLLLGEHLDRRRGAGLVLGSLGLACLGWPLLRAGSFGLGLVLALAAGLSWALGTVLTKRLPVTTPPVIMAAWQLVGGAAVALIGMAIFEPQTLGRGIGWAGFEARIWIALAHHILLSQALAYVIWYALLARLPAGTVSLSMLMVPAIGVVSSMAFLGERPTLTDLAGLVLMTAAAAAVNLPARRSRKPRRIAEPAYGSAVDPTRRMD